MNKTRMNPILATDSYKVSHWKQYPQGTRSVYSFLESRGGIFPETLFFGLQYILKRYFVGQVVTQADISEAREFFTAHFSSSEIFNEAGWQRIVDEHGGCLPVRIKAVAEGLRIPTGNVLLTMENTDPQLPWLTNYLETLILQVWYPTTVATQSYYMKKIIREFLEETGSPELIDFKLHDFGYRGSTSDESAGIGGAAHLVNFKGSDTLAGILVARDYYSEAMAGFSIPAAEHSTITAWGKSNERAAYENMLDQFPAGLVAVVSDSYDIFNACQNIWGQALHDKILERDGVLVVRPDSGDPTEVLPKMFSILGDAFGSEINAKGYKLLNPKVRVIQGDGIDRETLRPILLALKNNGWSADNIAFGSGGGLLQKVNRDTSKFAIKCSEVEVDGERRQVMKDPITDPEKRSKAGRMKLLMNAGRYETVAENVPGEDQLRVVFENGQLMREYSFEDIRLRADK
ncbi:MAG: nicotinate phosphoribosyltransferase [Candidatus Moraniibacteriota bacterium]